MVHHIRYIVSLVLFISTIAHAVKSESPLVRAARSGTEEELQFLQEQLKEKSLEEMKHLLTTARKLECTECQNHLNPKYKVRHYNYRPETAEEILEKFPNARDVLAALFNEKAQPSQAN